MSVGSVKRKLAALRIASDLAMGDAQAADAIVRSAEVIVMRRLLCARLVGGESAYWVLVAKEIES